VLEAQALDRVRELHVDAEVVAVELELVARLERVRRIDVHAQLRDVAVDQELPVVVTARVAVEVGHAGRAWERGRRVWRRRFVRASRIPHKPGPGMQ
jgi:hypothetical protein